MSSIFDLARLGAENMAQLREFGEEASLRADLNRIANDIEQSWTLADIERIEEPPYIKGANHLIEGYAKFTVRGTGGVIAIHKGWGHRLIHYVYEKEKT